VPSTEHEEIVNRAPTVWKARQSWGSLTKLTRPMCEAGYLYPSPETENPPQTLAGQGTPGMRSGENR
jgi:hypothetical protein